MNDPETVSYTHLDQQTARFPDGIDDGARIQRRNGAQVDQFDGDTLFGELHRGLFAFQGHEGTGHDGDVRAFGDYAGLTERDQLDVYKRQESICSFHRVSRIYRWRKLPWGSCLTSLFYCSVLCSSPSFLKYPCSCLTSSDTSDNKCGPKGKKTVPTCTGRFFLLFCCGWVKPFRAGMHLKYWILPIPRSNSTLFSSDLTPHWIVLNSYLASVSFFFQNENV